MNPVKTILIVLLSGHFLVAAQEPEIIILSIKVGSSIDAAENILMDLFPDIKGFESAQFYEISENRYMEKIVYVDKSRRRLKKRYFSWKQFQRLKYLAGSHPEITDEQREKQLDYLTYLQVHNIMDDIPPNTFCTLKHSNGQHYTGTFIRYDNRTIIFQTLTQRLQFSIDELESIKYRPFIDDGQPWKKTLAFSVGAIAGLVLAEVWNEQKSPRIDLIWNNRFVGIGVGLLLGMEMFEAVSVLTSPNQVIALTPEELAKMK
ncbi:MAG: hypothetical protein MK299_12805 [Pseudomonadales bacterium]|nr:hypothetical protein [Pseudomonadales bacterium]